MGCHMFSDSAPRRRPRECGVLPSRLQRVGLRKYFTSNPCSKARDARRSLGKVGGTSEGAEIRGAIPVAVGDIEVRQENLDLDIDNVLGR
jgi:hypothetical protein